MTEEELDSLYSIHFKGVFFLTQKLLPLINDGGWIVMTLVSRLSCGCQGMDSEKLGKILSDYRGYHGLKLGWTNLPTRSKSTAPLTKAISTLPAVSHSARTIFIKSS